MMNQSKAESEEAELGWTATTLRLLQFALPTFLLMALGTVVLLFEVWLVARLGLVPLAGFTLCLPLAFLMTTMSAGGLGGGVTSAVARAVGSAPRRVGLVQSAMALGVTIGFFCTLVLGVRPEWILARMTDDTDAVIAASEFAVIFFAGAPLLWLSNTLASIHRGLGHPARPAKIGGLVAVLQVAISYPVILGVGSFAGLGLKGAALVPIVGYALQVFLLLRILRSELGAQVSFLSSMKVQWASVADILAVGLPSSINTLTVAFVSLQLTGAAAGIGTAELAAFGVSARVESIVMPLVFSVGTSLVALIGIEWGRGHFLQARRFLIVGAVLSLLLTFAVGLSMALMPLSVFERFSGSAGLALAARDYLRVAGPSLGLLGLGLAFSFAGQGIKRPLPSLAASLSRLVFTAICVQWIHIQNLTELGWLTASGFLLYAVILVSGVAPLFRRKSFHTQGSGIPSLHH